MERIKTRPMITSTKLICSSVQEIHITPKS